MSAPPRDVWLKGGALYNHVVRLGTHYILKSDYDALQVKLTEAERLNKVISDAVVAMADDGWLYHGVEGMSEAQQKCYDAYNAIRD